MNRRRFLAAMAGGAVALWVPGAKMFSLPPRPRVIGDDFRVLPSGDVRYIGAVHDEVEYSIAEFGKWLSRQSVDIGARLEHHVDLQHPFNIDSDVAMHLKGGSLTQRRWDRLYHDVWFMSRIEIGDPLTPLALA